MILHIAAREVAEHVRSARFLSLCALVALLLPLGAHLEADGYHARRAHAEWLREQRREHARRADATIDPTDGVQWGWNAGEVRSDPALASVRPPSPLATLVAGDDATLPAWWQHSSEGLVPGGDAPHLPTAPLDALFVVQTVLGLLAILLTFDAIAGEQESGVLRLVLAHPVPRLALLVGKFLGALLTLAVPALLGCVAAVGVLLVRDVPLFDDGGAARLALAAAAAALYVATLAGAGLAACAIAARARTALVALLMVWAVTALVVPRLATVVAASLRPVASEAIARRQRADAILALERERATRLASAWRAASGGDGIPAGELPAPLRRRYAAARAPIEAELFRRKRQALADLDARRRAAIDRQARLARVLGAASPAVLLGMAATALAGTGDGRRDAWMRQLQAHQDRLAFDAFDRVYGVELYDAGAGYVRIRWAPDIRDPRDRPPAYADLTQLRWTPPTMGEAVRESLPALVGLVAMSAAALGVAAVAMVRYEVR